MKQKTSKKWKKVLKWRQKTKNTHSCTAKLSLKNFKKFIEKKNFFEPRTALQYKIEFKIFIKPLKLHLKMRSTHFVKNHFVKILKDDKE